MVSDQIFTPNTDTEFSRVRELLRRSSGKPALIVGTGITGRSLAQLLARAGYLVTLLDQRPVAPDQREAFAALGATVLDNFSPDAQGAGTALSERGYTFAVLSPGVSVEGPLAQFIGRLGIPKLSELDLALPFIGMPLVAVTGTNGKTTTTSIIYEMLRASGLSAELAGNIGRPFVELVDPAQLSGSLPPSTGASRPLVVAEVSSYQLEAAFDFTPRVGVWLNLSENHLERHGTMKEYLRVKSKIFRGQNDEDEWSVMFADSPFSKEMASYARGRHFFFGTASQERLKDPNGAYFHPQDNAVHLTISGNRETYSLSGSKLIGFHNRLNFAAAIAAARLAGANPEAIRSTISSFQPIEHRIELAAEKNGVLYINDSKATTVAATAADLEAVRSEMKDSAIVLLVGGQAKKGSWDALRALIGRSIRAVIGFGADGQMILTSLSSGEGQLSLWPGAATRFEYAPTVSEAVRLASSLAEHGNVVLFAPGCASFDAYSSFEERGRHFKQIVQEL